MGWLYNNVKIIKLSPISKSKYSGLLSISVDDTLTAISATIKMLAKLY
jgi:hypothetical protein